jgi:hypothetical protein
MTTATRTNVPTGQVWPARTLALISAVFAAGFIVDGLFGMMIPELAYDGRPVVWDAVLRAVLHLGQIAAASAIGTAGLAGSGLTARIGLPLWIVGGVCFVAGELLYLVAPRPADIAFQVGSVAILVGMVLAGVGVLRTGRWTGPGRFLPLTTGLYVIPLLPATRCCGCCLAYRCTPSLVQVRPRRAPMTAQTSAESPTSSRHLLLKSEYPASPKKQAIERSR